MKKLTVILFFLSLMVFTYDGFAQITFDQLKEKNSNYIESLNQSWIESGGLEVITGGPSKSNTQSRWGHTSLRFIGSGESLLNDIIVEAVALNDNAHGTLKLVYNGLTGGYPIVLNFKGVGDQIRYYYHTELRGYKRTIIPTSVEMRKSLIEQLTKLNNALEPKDEYYFLSNNCTSYMAKVLLDSGFGQIKAAYPFRPSEANIHYRKSYLSPWPELPGLSIEELKLLEISLENVNFTTIPTIDLQKLMVFTGLDLGEKMNLVIMELERRTDTHSTGHVYGLAPFPESAYQLDSRILESSLRTEISSLPVDLIKETNLYNRAAWFTATPWDFANFCNQYQSQCDYFKAAMNFLISYEKNN